MRGSGAVTVGTGTRLRGVCGGFECTLKAGLLYEEKGYL